MSYLLDKRIVRDGNMDFRQNERTAIQVATKNGHFDVVQILMEKCKSVRDTVIE